MIDSGIGRQMKSQGKGGAIIRACSTAGYRPVCLLPGWVFSRLKANTLFSLEMHWHIQSANGLSEA